MRVYIPLINVSNHGGVRVIIELANYLSSKGHEVIILSPSLNDDCVYKINSFVYVKKINPKLKSKSFRYLIFLLTYPIFIKRDSIIITNFFPTFYPALIAAIFKKSKHLYFIQDIESKYKNYILNKLCNFTYKFKFLNKKISANNFLSSVLINDFGSDVLKTNIGLNNLFIDKENSNSKKYDLVIFARSEPWKRFSLAEEIVVNYNNRYNQKLSVIAITQDKELKHYIEDNEVFETVISPRNDDELIRCIDSSRILLFTSAKEGFGLPPLECMSRGIPGVVFFCGGPEIYIKNGVNSFLVDNIDDAVDSLFLLKSNPSLYESISNRAYIDSRYYSNTSAFEIINKYIREM